MKPPQICLSTNDTQQADHFLDTPGLLQLFLLLLDFLAAIAPQTQRQQLGPFHQQLGRQPCHRKSTALPQGSKKGNSNLHCLLRFQLAGLIQISLDELNRKPLSLVGKSMVSSRFFL